MDSLSSSTAPTTPAAAPTPAAQPRRRRFSKNLLAGFIILLGCMLAVIAGILKYGGVPTSTQGPPTGLYLNSISMVSPDEGWAVGNTSPYYMVDASNNITSGDKQGVKPTILHYAQGRWTPEPLPNFQHSALCTSLESFYCANIALNSISMVSAQEGWAAGSTIPPVNVTDITPLGMLLHYVGGKWVLVNLQVSYLTSLYMRSASDGWMIGNKLGMDGGGPPEVWHYDGHIWSPVSDSLPASIIPYAITGAANGELWVSGIDYSVSVGNGEDGNNPTVLLHYDGTRWNKVDPHIANGRLSSFTFTSPDEGWAVGTLPNTNQHRPSEADGLILRYHNGAWQEQTHFKDPFGQAYFSLTGVTMASAQEGWAVGQDGVMVQYHNGVWQQAQSVTRANLSSVAFVSASEGWAIGDHGTILHYHNGVWSVYQG